MVRRSRAAEGAPATNPVWDRNFADPAVLRADGVWWAFATNGTLGNVQVLRSPDMRRWEPVGDALPALGAWASKGRTWAPEVAVGPGGRYLMYYTARVRRQRRQAIGCAVADHPAGPYVDDSEQPLIDDRDEGGSIDATPFTDTDGSRYLWWKNDGNAVGADTWLYAARLSEDGRSLAGEPVRVLKQDLPWEGTLVEGPFLHRRDGVLHLFYSANAFDSADYAVGHAVLDGPMGPAHKSGDPILTTNDVAVGPGHCVVVEDGGRTWMVHHAYRPDGAGGRRRGRRMWLTEILWDGDEPVCDGPRIDLDH
jgi:GH43 family beta-xylosidase